jgi:hypothetical protein
MRLSTGTIQLGLAALSALALAACGGSSSNSSTGATSSDTTHTTTQTGTQATQSVTSSSTTTTSATTSVSGPPPCQATGLALSFLGQQGATGHGELGFALRNTHSVSCNTIGYPGIQFISRSGTPLPTTPLHTKTDFFGHSPLRELIVAPGQTVSFRLGVTHGISSSAGCTTAYALQVIPPNDTAMLHISIPDGATECGTATVSPMRAGTSAYP